MNNGWNQSNFLKPSQTKNEQAESRKTCSRYPFREIGSLSLSDQQKFDTKLGKISSNIDKCRDFIILNLDLTDYFFR